MLAGAQKSSSGTARKTDPIADRVRVRTLDRLDDRVNEIDDVAPLTQGHRVVTCGATNVQKSTRGRGEHSLEERQRSHVLHPWLRHARWVA